MPKCDFNKAAKQLCRNRTSKNADVIRNMQTIQTFFRFHESFHKVLVVCQKLAVKLYPMKS